MDIRISLDSIAQHRIRVEVAIDRAPGDDPTAEFLMPVWTPGSYLVREYARHILDFAAVDGVRGVALPHAKTAKNRYRVDVPPDCERVLVRYTVYAHSLTVREAWVGEEFAYWNGACTYLWPADGVDRKARIRVELPEGWTLYAGAQVSSEGVFEVDGIDEAVDTPCLALADADVVEFTVRDATVRFVCAGLGGTIRPPSSLEPHTRSIVEHAADVFTGTLPFREYSFLSLFAAAGRGGLEHRDSSTLLAPRTTFAPDRDYAEFMSLVAHEFFHVWNVKRLRPRDFMQFDYEREQHTRLLWVAEGFTAYYDDHLCLRAEIVDAATYLRTVSTHVAGLLRTPGRFVQSLGDASFDAWIRFYRPDENTRNATQNYYSAGALVAIVLDAWLRDATDGERSLDDLMRRLFEARVETGYVIDDVIEIASDIAGRDLAAPIHELVEGDLDPDLEAVLAVYGLGFDANATSPSIGVQFQRGTTTIATVFVGFPASRAGLSPGDEVLAVAGLRVTADTWGSVFPQVAKAGEPLEVLVARQGRIVTCRVEPSRERAATIVPVADADERARRLRRGWLGPTSDALPGV